jgi:hypothetical protein
MGDASLMEKSAFNPDIDHLRSLPVKQVIYNIPLFSIQGCLLSLLFFKSTYDFIFLSQVIGDVPWPPGGKETKGSSGYPTDVNWENVLKGLKSTSDRTSRLLCHPAYATLVKNLCGTVPVMDVDEKGLPFQKSPTGAPGITLFGDFKILKNIETKAGPLHLKVYGNNPGIVVWERPRATEKKNNAPAAGGSFFMNMSLKVSILPWQVSIYCSFNPIFQMYLLH